MRLCWRFAFREGTVFPPPLSRVGLSFLPRPVSVHEFSEQIFRELDSFIFATAAVLLYDVVWPFLRMHMTDGSFDGILFSVFYVVWRKVVDLFLQV